MAGIASAATLPTHCMMCGKRFEEGHPFEPLLAYGPRGQPVNLGIHLLCRIELTAKRVALHLDDDFELEQDSEDDYLDEALAELVAKKVKRQIRNFLREDD